MKNYFNVKSAENLLQLIIKYGGSVVSSNELHPDLINQARESGRMFVDCDGYGFIWEPPFAKRFPMTTDEIKLWDLCYPIEIEIPSDLNFENLMKRIIKSTNPKYPQK